MPIASLDHIGLPPRELCLEAERQVPTNCQTVPMMAKSSQSSYTAAYNVRLIVPCSMVTSLPVMVQPNAGQPKLVNMKVVYDETPEQMVTGVVPLLEAGANIVGACCGSRPAHIRAFRQAMDQYLPGKKETIHENQAV